VKHIGLLGAISWAPTSEHHRPINEVISNRLGGPHSSTARYARTGNEGTEPTMKGWHMPLCGLLIATGVVLVATSAGGAASCRLPAARR
jgi:hypothetical protein